jgi:hypothetical protein
MLGKEHRKKDEVDAKAVSKKYIERLGVGAL